MQAFGPPPMPPRPCSRWPESCFPAFRPRHRRHRSSGGAGPGGFRRVCRVRDVQVARQPGKQTAQRAKVLRRPRGGHDHWHRLELRGFGPHQSPLLVRRCQWCGCRSADGHRHDDVYQCCRGWAVFAACLPFESSAGSPRRSCFSRQSPSMVSGDRRIVMKLAGISTVSTIPSEA